MERSASTNTLCWTWHCTKPLAEPPADRAADRVDRVPCHRQSGKLPEESRDAFDLYAGATTTAFGRVHSRDYTRARLHHCSLCTVCALLPISCASRVRFDDLAQTARPPCQSHTPHVVRARLPRDRGVAVSCITIFFRSSSGRPSLVQGMQTACMHACLPVHHPTGPTGHRGVYVFTSPLGLLGSAIIRKTER